ncbi:MAG: hypothetical protein ACKVOH_04515 [Chlamydiales bacterium]
MNLSFGFYYFIFGGVACISPAVLLRRGHFVISFIRQSQDLLRTLLCIQGRQLKIPIMRNLPFCLALLSCTSQRHLVNARSEYLYPDYPASVQISTPPCYDCFVGQQVISYWRLPSRFSLENSKLLLSVRYGDHAIEHFERALTERSGYWIYRLLNDEYWCRDGILSYSAKVVHNGQVIDQWDHHLWQEVIVIPRE